MPGSRVSVTVLGVLACTAYAVVGCLQILVWNPLAAVPGRELGEIHRLMREAREPMAVDSVLIRGALGVVLAVAVAVVGARRRWNTQQFLVTFLGVLVLGAPWYFFASFGPGMSLADAFAIGGGDHAPWGLVLCGVSGMALLLIIALGYREAWAERRRTRAALQ